jgi:hypothetical protein
MAEKERTEAKKKIVSAEFYNSAWKLSQMLSGEIFDELPPEVQRLVRIVNTEFAIKALNAQEREIYQEGLRADRAKNRLRD